MQCEVVLIALARAGLDLASVNLLADRTPSLDRKLPNGMKMLDQPSSWSDALLFLN